MFSTHYKRSLCFFLSENALNLDQSKNMSFGKEFIKGVKRSRKCHHRHRAPPSFYLTFMVDVVCQNVGKNARGKNAIGKNVRGKIARGKNVKAKVVKIP